LVAKFPVKLLGSLIEPPDIEFNLGKTFLLCRLLSGSHGGRGGTIERSWQREGSGSCTASAGSNSSVRTELKARPEAAAAKTDMKQFAGAKPKGPAKRKTTGRFEGTA